MDCLYKPGCFKASYVVYHTAFTHGKIFQTCLVRGNIVVCSVTPRYVCGHTHTMQGSYTSNTTNVHAYDKPHSWYYRRQEVRNSEPSSSSTSSSRICQESSSREVSSTRHPAGEDSLASCSYTIPRVHMNS